MRFSIIVFGLLKVFLLWQDTDLALTRSAPPLKELTPVKRAYNGLLFYYWHCLELEHLGDLGQEFTGMTQYSAEEINSWVHTIEILDATPNLLPFLLSYYFATPHNPLLTLVCLTALEAHCFKAIEQKWRFVVQAILIAKHYLNNQDLALHLADRLIEEMEPETQPLFIRTLPATLLAKTLPEAAIKIYSHILASNQKLSPQELAFIKSRIKFLMELNHP